MPTSVLLAVLAAAGLLALAPALTRRYDATERVAAERATSTARVLSRRRRRRTVPGPRPINRPRFLGMLRGGSAATAEVRRGRSASSVDGSHAGVSRGSRGTVSRRGGVRSGGSDGRTRRVAHGRRPVPTAMYRRRGVLLALVLLNLVELAGVLLVGPGFWIGFSVSFAVLVADLVYLRRRVVLAARRGRSRMRRAAWVEAQQAAVRLEHTRRAAERQAALRHAAADRHEASRDPARRATAYGERHVPRTAPGP